MAWPVPKYSKSQVNRAGHILTADHFDHDRFLWAYDVVNNWRSCHGYPINTFNATLRQKLKSIDDLKASMTRRSLRNV